MALPLAIDCSPASERLARERGDHRAIAAMLSARASATDNVEQRRLIRLRRAAVLEQRLDRHEEACAELERILEETGEDATALRYLADLYGRTERPTRAARMWLRASKQATNLDEKLRDVIRCCESLVVANRPETARRLLDAARSLPQSPRLLRLRVAVARQLEDPLLLATAQAELDALGPTEDMHSAPPSESLRALDSSPPSMPPPATSSSEPPPSSEPSSSEELELETEDSEPPPAPLPSSPPPAAVTAPLPAPSEPSPAELPDSDATPTPVGPSPTPVGTEFEGAPQERGRRPSAPSADRFVADVLENCRVAYVERGTGTARDARHLVRRLRAVRDGLSEADADLYTFLLVEALDAVKGPAAAMGTLQEHWERRGGTPLATVAVAERLVRRGDLRPALLLYERVKGKALRGVRSEGQVALDAAEVAREVGDDDVAEQFLELAALHPDARPEAESLFARWFSSSPSTAPPGEGSRRPVTSSIPPAPISGEWSGETPPSADGPLASDAPPTPEQDEPDERESIDDLDLDESGSVTSEPTPSPAPLRLPSVRPAAFASVFSRPPAFPEFIAPEEEELFDELINGSFEAGDRLVAAYRRDGSNRTHDALAVRRYQAALHRGEREALANLVDAAIADNSIAFARAVEHVLGAFDPAYDRVDPPPLEQLAPQPEATAKLLFSPHDGTISEALGLVCESGMLRRNLKDYGFTGADRVPPVATTPLGRVYAALSRLLDLGGVRLFHRSRAAGRLSSAVALTTPLAAVLSGVADRETRELQYILGSALVAATPQLALVESLDEPKARNLVRALLAGFGPVEDRSMGEASMEQMRMAEDLWHMVPSAAERRLHQVCENRREMTYEAAVANARATRRRAGLFASGDLVTAMTATIRELDLPVPRPLRGEGVLRELCNDPELGNLYDFAILPEYAEARWTGGV
ncbi:MAG: hypothetical protein JRI68_04255 [Deltaproteobacteria bacterium]|nr:hypothetical protein [Deltaproteobacteria bacterium]